MLVFWMSFLDVYQLHAPFFWLKRDNWPCSEWESSVDKHSLGKLIVRTGLHSWRSDECHLVSYEIKINQT